MSYTNKRLPGLVVGLGLLAALGTAHAGTAHGVAQEPRHLTGGVSIEQAAELQGQRGDFSLWLVTAAPSGAYLAGAWVTILDATDQTVLRTQLDGPYLMADLAPGRYAIQATYGEQTRETFITIQPGENEQVLLRFDSPAQLSPDLRR